VGSGVLTAAVATAAAGFSQEQYCGFPPSIPTLPSGATLIQAQLFIRHGDRVLADENVW
jgi:hypothetical protein